MKPPNQDGFTLIEILLVLILISLLAGVAAPMVSTYITRAKEAALKENLYVMRKAIDDYYADKGRYPTSLDVLVEDKYIRFLPLEPFAGSTEGWRTETSDVSSDEYGIGNVFSANEGQALNGSYYSEW